MFGIFVDASPNTTKIPNMKTLVIKTLCVNGDRGVSFSAWLKSKTADKVLSPIRDRVFDLIDEGSQVLEVGCGTGDLLFRASNKIDYGLGVDLDQGMIEFANKRVEEEKVENIEFIEKDIKSLSDSLLRKFNISTSTLCFHEMREEDAISSLSLLAKHSSKVIIADYAPPNTVWGKVSIELDEMISGHYGKFKSYREKGGIPYLAKASGLKVVSEMGTPIDGILIWVLSGR